MGTSPLFFICRFVLSFLQKERERTDRQQLLHFYTFQAYLDFLKIRQIRACFLFHSFHSDHLIISTKLFAGWSSQQRKKKKIVNKAIPLFSPFLFYIFDELDREKHLDKYTHG